MEELHSPSLFIHAAYCPIHCQAVLSANKQTLIFLHFMLMQMFNNLMRKDYVKGRF